MTHHKPPPGVGFLCSRDDMRRWSEKDASAAIRMEVEANEFSALILMPPPLWRKATAKFRDPDLAQIVALAKDFCVSKEAAARSYAQYHNALVAIVVVKDGKIDRIYRNITTFPRLCVERGQPVPASSIFHRTSRQFSHSSSVEEARAEFWLESDFGKRLPALYEQVQFQQGGYALLMLWAEPVEEEEEQDDDRTSKERLRDRQAAWRR